MAGESAEDEARLEAVIAGARGVEPPEPPARPQARRWLRLSWPGPFIRPLPRGRRTPPSPE